MYKLVNCEEFESILDTLSKEYNKGEDAETPIFINRLLKTKPTMYSFTNAKNEFLGVGVIKEFMGEKLVKVFAITSIKRKACYKIISKEFPEFIINSKDEFGMDIFECLEKLGYNKCSIKSSYNDEWYDDGFVFKFLEGFWTKGNVDKLVQSTEANLFPAIKEVTYSCMNGEELKELLKSNICFDCSFFASWTSVSCNHERFAGFHYFNYGNLSNVSSKSDIKYIVACNGNNVIGIIRWGIWNPEEERQSLAYIDVAMPYRHMGIAKGLAKELDKHLDTALPLILTDESEIGRMYHMNDMFKTIIKRTKVISYSELIA